MHIARWIATLPLVFAMDVAADGVGMSHGTSAPSPARASSHAAAVAMQDVLIGNSVFAKSHQGSFFAPFQESQHPEVTLVTCADSRVHTRLLMPEPDGHIFTVRNIGNQFGNNAGSVEYGVRHLHTPLLLIMGHVGCGAVKAAMGDYSAESLPIRSELDSLHLALRNSAKASWTDAVSANVHAQVEFARAAFAAEIAHGDLAVVGAVYDFQGKLGAAGKLHVVNINGERSAQVIAKSPLLQKLDVHRKLDAAMASVAHGH